MSTPPTTTPDGPRRPTWPQAAELQTAADTLRERAQHATPGPWRNHDTHLGRYGHTATVLSGDGNNTDLRAWLPSLEHEPWDERRNVWHDAAYIATVDPAVGLALADLLDGLANALAWLAPYREHEPGYPMWEAATELARAINGTPAPASGSGGSRAQDGGASYSRGFATGREDQP